MAPRKGRDIAASVRARLRQLAGQRGEDFEYLLGRYAIESLLRRLAASPHHDRFVLKGAMLFVLWGMEKHRVTRDVDFLGFGELSPESLARIFREITMAPGIEDGVTFLAESVKADLIRREDPYGGTRVEVRAVIARAEIRVQIDVGAGDDAPGCRPAEFPTLLGGTPPVLRAYTPELAIAEKLHAMVDLGIANSRMKDYFDILVLSNTLRFGLEELSTAIRRTFLRRQTTLPSSRPIGLSEAFGADPQKLAQWRAFLRKNRRDDAPNDLLRVVRQLAQFLERPIQLASPGGQATAAFWDPHAREWVAVAGAHLSAPS